MKKVLLLFVFAWAQIFASEKRLLPSVLAVFRTFPKESNVEFCDSYYQEEECAVYVGKRVCEEVIVGRSATPALKQLVAFIGTDGKRYSFMPFPKSKKNESFVITSDFDEGDKSFFMRREKKAFCFAFFHKQQLGDLEIVHTQSK